MLTVSAKSAFHDTVSPYFDSKSLMRIVRSHTEIKVILFSGIDNHNDLFISMILLVIYWVFQ